MVEIKKGEKAHCVYCGSRFVYIRIKDKTVVCRSCGQVSDIDDYDIEEIKEE